MMRGQYNWAVAVRTPDGEIHTEEHDLASGTAKRGWMRWPIVRGVRRAGRDAVACDEGVLGLGVACGRDRGGAALRQGDRLHDGARRGARHRRSSSCCPPWLTNFVAGSAVEQPVRVEHRRRHAARRGVLRLHLGASAGWPTSSASSRYHGAEHKTIHAYEHNLPLEPELIQRYETLHVRCGTSFLLMVMIVAIIVFSLVPVRLIAAALRRHATSSASRDRDSRAARAAAARRRPRLRDHREVGRQPLREPVRAACCCGRACRCSA